ncbi:TetR family transcriptional regulator [Sinobacterium caligoides]|uniref:TetR family transcriptional regulator n=1 Tax=Sinobacterium caligoides TaxID=933926 RepID=A0A3N2E136_9GAMM|nr:TetR/AcrR family transcriptional regulator [Sinobacterium caligoides]ROS05285.1 TetR family transcriptional regulator [Sinobacterium caligoides]
MTTIKKTYHHGDLRRSLLDEAVEMIDELGFEGISMRKLADRVGVSRTALYHHFDSKQALLCAVAEDGFIHYTEILGRVARLSSGCHELRMRAYVAAYIDFAMEHSAYYDLMFGREIWKQAAASDSLKEVSYAAFKGFVKTVEQWQREGVLPMTADALRYSQVVWACLHGLSRLLIDGIYVDRGAREGMIDMATQILIQNLGKD